MTDYSTQFDVDNASSGSVLLRSLAALIKSTSMDVKSSSERSCRVLLHVSASHQLFTSQAEPEEMETDKTMYPFLAWDDAESGVYKSWTLKPFPDKNELHRNELRSGVSLKFVAQPNSAWRWEQDTRWTIDGQLKVYEDISRSEQASEASSKMKGSTDNRTMKEQLGIK